MNLATVILRLPVGIARGVTDFLFVPSRGAHPHRIAAWVPSVIDESQPAAAKPLADLLGQAEPVLEFDQPLHQVALLPQPWLADLARRIAIDALDWALRQVVWRKDLEQLDPYVTEADWQRIYAPPAQGANRSVACTVPPTSFGTFNARAGIISNARVRRCPDPSPGDCC